VVPQPLYPESTHSSSSGSLNKLLKTKLREHALVLRGLSSSLRKAGQLSEGDILAALRCKKEELLGEVYNVMTATLGVPPQPNGKFVWDYYDKDGKAGRWEGTAKQFYAVRHKCSQFEGELSLFFLGILQQALSNLRLVLSYQ
jgi:bleomycin hydrolase